MTAREFGELPQLLRRKEFLEATGMDWRRLEQAIQAGEVEVVRLAGWKYGKYKKVDAARISGLPL